MIIGTYDGPLEIGKVINTGEVSNHESIYREQPFVVIREATYEEYINQLKELDYKGSLLSRSAYFYEVSTD